MLLEIPEEILVEVLTLLNANALVRFNAHFALLICLGISDSL